MRHSMRRPRYFAVVIILGLSSMFQCGCSMINPNSKINVNRGDYHDEWDAGGVERRATDGMEHEDAEGLDNWIHSPKYRAINRNLGLD